MFASGETRSFSRQTNGALFCAAREDYSPRQISACATAMDRTGLIIEVSFCRILFFRRIFTSYLRPSCRRETQFSYQ